MHCAACGEPLAERAAYCSACGAPVAAATGPTRRLGDTEPLGGRQQPPQPRVSMRDGACPQCGSTDLVPNQPIYEHTSGGHTSLAIELVEHPDVLFSKGDVVTSHLRAWICGGCGAVEISATNHRQLFDAYVRRRERRSG